MDKNVKPHFFIAVPLPKEIKSVIDEWTNQLKLKYTFKNWVHPEDYHITLAFLGHGSFQTIQQVKKSLVPVIKEHDPFELTLNGLGIFGQKQKPRILWGGIEESQELLGLQQTVYKQCKSLGFSLDERQYRPHITLAGKWADTSSFPYDKFHNALQPKEGNIRWTVDHIVIYQTHLERTPKYQLLKMIPLKKISEINNAGY